MNLGIRFKQSDLKTFTSKAVYRARKVVPKAMATELKQVIIDNSNHLVGIDGRKNKKLTKKYEAFKRRMGVYPQPDFRLTGSFLEDARVSGGTLSPLGNLKKAEGLMKKRKPYPEQESDISKKSMKRLEQAGEKAFSE